MSTFMRPFLSLPDEPLHFVIEYIAYGPVLPEDFKNFVSRSRFTRPSLTLLALSVANRRVRQICLSFLFASIRIHKNIVEKLDEHVALFSRFTKTLVIEDLFPLGYTTGHRIIERILSQLEQIRYVELRHSRVASGLLRTVLATPTVTSVLISELPDQSMHNDDLSKVTLSGYSRTPPESFSGLEKCLDHGMKLARYALHTLDAVKFHNHSSNTLKRVRTLPGLEGILLQLYHGIPASFPQWLSILSIHPTLKELWLIDELCSCDIPTTALISFLDEKYHCQDLTRGFDMECVVFNRDIGRSSSSQEWYVKAITLKSNSATTSLIQMLTLAASAFPELEVLTLRLEFHEAKYDVGDFVSVFAQFFSLRAVFLHDVYKRLIFESANDNSMPSPPVKITVYRAPNPDETIPIIPAASGILQITSLLAKQNKTLDFFSFKDEISRDEDGQLSCPGPGSGKLVFLEGELQVLNSNRDVDASFMVYSTPG